MDNLYSSYDIASELYNRNDKGIRHSRKKVKGIAIDDMKITSSENRYGKKVGRYVLLDSVEPIEEDDEDLILTLAKYLKSLLRSKLKSKRANVLVVGLGNKDYNPDSLGPKVIDDVIVNYHLKDDALTKSLYHMMTAAFTPGVMASTGLESSDMIKAIVRDAKIDIVIVIDALATRTMRRLNRVIQLTDTGISPGSGVGNNRKALDEEFLGIPVIALGVATVIDKAAIVLETLRDIPLSDDSKTETANLIIESLDNRIVMTTKDIDYEIVQIAKVVSKAINITLGN